MPTFHRKKKLLKTPKKRRTFSSKKVGKLRANKSVPEKNPEELRAKEAKETTSKTGKKKVKVKNGARESIDKTIRVDVEKNEETVLKQAISEGGIGEKDEPQIDEIDRMIETASNRLGRLAIEGEEEDVQAEEPEVYDGINGEEERIRLLEERLNSEQKKASNMSHKIKLLKAEFEAEKAKLEKKVRDLRKDMHRAEPIEETKFFSLSRDLKGAINEIEKLVDQKSLNSEEVDNTSDGAEDISEKLEKRIVKKDHEDENDKSKTEGKESKKEGEPDKKKGNKKALITGGAALAVALVISGGVSATFFSKPTVNETLVEEYLSRDGEVAGAVSGGKTDEQAREGGELTRADYQKMAEEALNAVVPFEETKWKEFNDPLFGVRMDYPENAVKLIKTDSSATFSRKQGYIFRIQLIETGLDLESYWNQIKSTNYDYSSEETIFQGHEALALTLEEKTEYPGNKYLVKVGESIFDIWYAVPSDKFSEDDIQRVDKMLRTINFIKV